MWIGGASCRCSLTGRTEGLRILRHLRRVCVGRGWRIRCLGCARVSSEILVACFPQLKKRLKVPSPHFCRRSQVSARSACAKRVVFVWAIRHASHIKWIARELNKAVSSALPDMQLSISVYVTSAVSATPELSRSTSSGSSSWAPCSIESQTHADIIATVPTLDENRMCWAGEGKGDDEKMSGMVNGRQPYLQEEFDVDIRGMDVYVGRPDIHS